MPCIGFSHHTILIDYHASNIAYRAIVIGLGCARFASSIFSLFRFSKRNNIHFFSQIYESQGQLGQISLKGLPDRSASAWTGWLEYERTGELGQDNKTGPVWQDSNYRTAGA
jgi:hypothetical protein